MIINRKNIELVNELLLHDMELLDIKIDYLNHRVEIILAEQNGKHVMMFEHMQNFSIGGFEPWGEGIYVSEVKTITSGIERLINTDDGRVIDAQAFVTEILINSGDKILILSTQIEYV